MGQLSHEKLKEYLTYSPTTGDFLWNVSRGKCKKGDVAGCLNGRGYTLICLDGKIYLAHRLAFYYMSGQWPVEFIDHIDRDVTNNKYSNLREASQEQNQHNRTVEKGYHKHGPSWRVKICVNKIRKVIGVFKTEAEARTAYLEAKAFYHPESLTYLQGVL